MPLKAVIGSPPYDFTSKPVAVVSITAKKQSDQKNKDETTNDYTTTKLERSRDWKWGKKTKLYMFSSH
eukprot:1780748-Ditylum_brightwellii.AAC.1